MKFNFIEKTGSYIPEPENYNDVLELIKSDYFRMIGRKDSLIKMFLYTFYEPSFKFMFWHRISAFKRKIHFGSLVNYYTDAICLNTA